MLNLLEAHAPHIGPVLFVFGAILWLWLRDLRTQPADDERERRREWNAEAKAHRLQSRTTRRVSRHALVLLGGVALLLGTSIVLYVTETLGGPQLLLMVWAHTVLGLGICTLAFLKLRAIGTRKIRRTMRFESLLRITSSTTLTALLLPLLVTGVILVFVPSTSGFAARLHLLMAAWFSLLVITHTVSLVRGVTARLGRDRSAPTGRLSSRVPLALATPPQRPSSRERVQAATQAASSITKEGRV